MKRLILLCLSLTLVLSACSMQLSSLSPQGSEVRAWFDAPLPGTVIHLPAHCQIVAHGASLAGIAAFELSVNGAVQANIPSPDTQDSLALLTQDCGLSAPGHYLLDLRARDKGGTWSNTAQTDVTIVAGETPTATLPTPETPLPTFTSTASPTPSLTPTSQVAGSVTIQSVSTDLVYLGARTCGPLDVSITAHATAPKAIQVVVLFYRFEPGSPSGFQNVAMDPIGGDLYQSKLNPTSILGGSMPADQATLQYQVVVQQTGGDTSIRTPVLADVAVQACGNVSAPDCSTYTTKRSCESHGCNWVSKPAIVPVFVCQNP